ncbi:MAG TPA: hypothetical protein VLG50_00680 [Candidatus Saccharimonadales bacterium]|nr:hypothetical protein [Candidatus Saccharimonadales bacterium]
MKKQIILAAFLLYSTTVFSSEKQEQTTQTAESESDRIFRIQVMRYNEARRLEQHAIYEQERRQREIEMKKIRERPWDKESISLAAGGIAMVGAIIWFAYENSFGELGIPRN